MGDDLAVRAADAANLSDEDLTALESEIVAAFDAADEAGDIDAMSTLADVLDTVRQELTARDSGDDQDVTPTSPVEDALAEVGSALPVEKEIDPDVEEESAELAPDDESAETVAPDESAETVAPDESAETVAPDAEEDFVSPADDEPDESDEKKKTPKTPVTASAVPTSQEADMEIPADRAPVTTAPVTTIVAGADIPGKSAGTPFGNADEISHAMMHRIGSISRASGGDGEQHIVATITASVRPDRSLVSGDAEANLGLLQKAISPQAVTAAGWCAPLETKYDLFGLGETQRPVRDALVGFQASRGGIRYVDSPVLTSFNAGIGHMTAAGVVTKATGVDNSGIKPCYAVACGTERTATLDAVTLCLEFGNLMSRAYPEMIARNNELALVQFARFAEDTLLKNLIAGSTTVTATKKWGTTRDVLVSIGKAAAAYRWKHRLGRSFPLRGIAPQFLLDAMREDLSVGLPGDNIGAADSVIQNYLSERNVSISWHLDGDKAGVATTAYEYPGSGSGAAGAVAAGKGTWDAFPTTTNILLFAEGTWLFLDGGTLDVGVVRDSTLVGTNSYKTFVEAFETTAKVGPDSLNIVADVSVLGAVNGTIVPV